jgi:hypothetical protein
MAVPVQIVLELFELLVRTHDYAGAEKDDVRLPGRPAGTQASYPYLSDPTHALPAGAYPWVTRAIATRAGSYTDASHVDDWGEDNDGGRRSERVGQGRKRRQGLGQRGMRWCRPNTERRPRTWGD